MTRLVWIIAAALAAMSGCASPANPAKMVPEQVAVQHRHAGSVQTAVLGGEETDPMWTSKIAGADYRTALDDAIRQSGVFAVVEDDPGSPYRLEVILLGLDQPMIGLSLSVTLSARWTLMRRDEPQALWQELILTRYTAGVGDAFYAVKRLRLANEGAARENIREGLERISRLAIP